MATREADVKKGEMALYPFPVAAALLVFTKALANLVGSVGVIADLGWVTFYLAALVLLLTAIKQLSSRPARSPVRSRITIRTKLRTLGTVMARQTQQLAG
jgi:hypothetical protein